MFRSILLPIDLGHDSSWQKPLPTACALAKANAAQLHVVNVVPDFGMSIVSGFFPEEFSDKAMEQAKQSLAEFMNAHIPEGVDARGHVVNGTIYKEILKSADQLSCDLIVLAAHRPELKDYLLGPNAARVVRHAKQSVFVVRD